MTDSHPAEAGASPAFPFNLTEIVDYDDAYGPADDPAPDTADPAPPAAKPAKYFSEIDGHAAPGSEGPHTAPWLDNNFTDSKRGRHDGWTPERKRLFHERLAEVGVVSEAAQAAGMSAHSAYALRNRDRMFDAGWEAALLLARRRLADELYARAVNGCVDQIHRDGAVVAERHRYDNRLSMAVLTRLDTRLDRAEARGDAHHRVAGRWDEYLDALGEDRADDARALIDPAAAAEAAKTARHRDLHDLRAAAPPAEPDPDEQDWHSVWTDAAGDHWTDYPPPPGFDGEERGAYGQDDYKRCLSDDEREIVDRDADVDAALLEDQGEKQRAAFFDALRLRLEEEACEDPLGGDAAAPVDDAALRRGDSGPPVADPDAPPP